MDRITGTAVADIGGGKRGFQDEILSTGSGSQEGTVVTANWLNAVQEEVLNVIEQSGQVPDDGDLTQLSQAIVAIAADQVPDIDLSGYVTNAALVAALADYLQKAGGTMTGPITLDGDPTQALHAATKQYVDNLMVGQVSAFAMPVPPTGWLPSQGALVSRTTFARLFAKIGTTFGAGDGSTTFALPDVPDFVRAWQSGGGRDFGSFQADALPDIGGTFGGYTSLAPSPTSGTFTSDDGTLSGPIGVDDANEGQNTTTFDISGVVDVADEVRPKNTALLYCIKY